MITPLKFSELQLNTYPLIVVIANTATRPRLWWAFWEPRVVSVEQSSFYNEKTNIAYMTEIDYYFYNLAHGKDVTLDDTKVPEQNSGPTAEGSMGTSLEETSGDSLGQSRGLPKTSL